MDLKKRLIRMIEDLPCEGPEEIGNCPYRKDGHCREMGKLDYCALSRLAEYLIESGAVAPENNPSAPAEHLPLGKGDVENDREKLIALLGRVEACLCTLCGEDGALERVSGVIADHLLANGVSIQIDNEKRVAKKDEEWRIPNIEFGTKKLGGAGPLDPFVVSVWWKMNVRGEQYGNYILFNCGTDSTYSVPCDEVIAAVNELLEQARDTYEYLEADDAVKPQEAE